MIATITNNLHTDLSRVYWKKRGNDFPNQWLKSDSGLYLRLNTVTNEEALKDWTRSILVQRWNDQLVEQL